MNAMIDELAKAVDEAWHVWRKEHGRDEMPFCDILSEKIARAVVARLMEPTPGMFKAGQGVILRQGKQSCNAQVNAEDVFRAMLSETVREG